MLNNPYSLHKQFFKWYIVPSCEHLECIPYINKYISFWYKGNAEVICRAMNCAWKDGYRFNDFEKG